MAVMALVGGVFAWRTVVIRREYDSHLPRPSVIDIPLIARIALGVYVLVMVVAILRGWNRRERAAGTGRSKLGQYGIPALAMMVLLGVGLVLLAIQQRPVRTPVPSVPAGPDAVAAVLPSELAALGYLPNDVHLLIGIHIAEAWRTPAGRPFLDGSQSGGSLGLDRLESITGLKMVELDHAVLAIKLDLLVPRFFLLVRTIQPYQQEEIRNALKATKLASTANRTLYEFTMQHSTLRAMLWFADKQTLVIAWPGTDLKEIPEKPRDGLHHLPSELRSVLTERLDPAARKAAAQLWLAGHVDDWKKLAASGLLAMQFKEAWPLLSQIKTVGVWSQLNEDVNLQAACRCADAESAEALRGFFQSDEAGKGVAGLLPKDSPVAADLTRTLKTTRNGDWITLEANLRAETFQKGTAPGK